MAPHFLVFPFMAQGHMIPMIDLAKLLAHNGAIITIVTTPKNYARFDSVLTRAIDCGLHIHVVQLQFPWNPDSGLPQGCENSDTLPSLACILDFFKATSLLYEPSEELFERLTPRPNCIISDPFLPWTIQLALKFHVPRLVLYPNGCFNLLCQQRLSTFPDTSKSTPDSDFVTVPDMPDLVKFRKSQLPRSTNDYTSQLDIAIKEADRKSHGIVLNVFEEMEPKYLAEYRKEREFPERVWCVGPLSLSNDNKLDKVERGNRAAIDEHECMKWLDGQNPSSVVYVSFGSMCNLEAGQLIELGLGLEASNRPFIWAIRKAKITEDLMKWLLEYDFEEKVRGRGLVICGWAPQVLILSHSAIGCFLMHCGWNAIMEGISAGVPMITWPLFGDHVYNEKLVVDILKVGVSLEDKVEKKVVVKREKVRQVIEMVMDEDGRYELTQRCREIADKAKMAMEGEGSSQRNIKLMIQEIETLSQGSSDNGS